MEIGNIRVIGDDWMLLDEDGDGFGWNLVLPRRRRIANRSPSRSGRPALPTSMPTWRVWPRTSKSGYDDRYDDDQEGRDDQYDEPYPDEQCPRC